MQCLKNPVLERRQVARWWWRWRRWRKATAGCQRCCCGLIMVLTSNNKLTCPLNCWLGCFWFSQIPNPNRLPNWKKIPSFAKVCCRSTRRVSFPTTVILVSVLVRFSSNSPIASSAWVAVSLWSSSWYYPCCPG